MVDSLGFEEPPWSARSKVLCCSSWGFRAFEYPVYFAAAAHLGFRCVEIEVTREQGSRCHVGPTPSDEDLRDRRQAAEEAGVEIAVLAGTNDFTRSEPSAIQEELAFVGRQIDAAEALHARVVRLFAGWESYERVTDATYDRVASCFREIASYAANKRLLIAVENHGGMTGTAAQMRRLLDLVNHPSVGCTFDPANFARCREDPLAAYELLRDRVLYLQLKDIDWRSGEPRYCAISEGSIGWDRLIPRLVTSYEGYWGIEYEAAADVMGGTRKSIAALRRLGVGT